MASSNPRTAYPFEPTFCPTTGPIGYSTLPPSPYGYELPSAKTYASVFDRAVPATELPPFVPVGVPVERAMPAAFWPSVYAERTPLMMTPTPLAYPPSAWPMINFSSPSPYNYYYPSSAVERPVPSMINNNNCWWPRVFDDVSTLCNVGFRPCSPLEFYCLTNPVRVLDRDGNRELWLCYDMRGFKPEEVSVTLNKTERCIVVEATHETKDGKEHHVSRKFYRKFVLPESLAKIDLTKCELKACFTADGLLNIECSLPRMTTDEIAKCPITARNFIRSAVSPNYWPLSLTPFNSTTPITCKLI